MAGCSIGELCEELLEWSSTLRDALRPFPLQISSRAGHVPGAASDQRSCSPPLEFCQHIIASIHFKYRHSVRLTPITHREENAIARNPHQNSWVMGHCSPGSSRGPTPGRDNGRPICGAGTISRTRSVTPTIPSERNVIA